MKKIVKIKGGLGNQLFQYAFAKLLEKKTGFRVLIDMSYFSEILNDPIRKPRILKYKLSTKIAGKEDLKKCCFFKHTGNTLGRKYRIGIGLEAVLNKRYFFERNRGYIKPEKVLNYTYYDGYWQSWRYVDEILKDIRNEFVPNYDISTKTKDIIEKVKQENSVFVGIRKGDYSNSESHFGSFGNDYYQKAMNYISSKVENPVFYVFSNDIPWVKENIDFSNRTVVYREPEDIVDDFEDFLIMTECKHSIIINSTFHWWGARLNYNKDKIVVAPQKWFFDDSPIDIIPPYWVRI